MDVLMVELSIGSLLRIWELLCRQASKGGSDREIGRMWGRDM